MTTDYQSQVEELHSQANLLPDGPSKLALLEEAVRLADTHQDVLLGDKLRAELIEAATFSGYPEKVLVAFAWRLAQCDRDPQTFSESALLWQYKWIISDLTEFPQITRKQIEEGIADMARRYQRAGASPRSIFKLRWQNALTMCEDAKAREFYPLWEKSPRDSNADCLACDQDHRIDFNVQQGETEKALELAVPILRGSLRCKHVPHRTYGRVLLPLLQVGRLEEAAKYHRKGYRLIRDNREFLWVVSHHLTFLVLTDNLTQAVNLFEKHLEWAVETKNLFYAWMFYLAARFLLSRVAESGRASLKLRLLKSASCYQEEGRYEVAFLASWVEATCRDLAARFDARNGNDGFTRELVAQPQLKLWLTPYPLGRSRKAE